MPESVVNIRPKLFFFDVDGTLLDAYGQYSKTLKPHIMRLKETGCKFAIASGRPAIAAQFLFDELEINDAGCFCSGAEVFDPQKGKQLYSKPLESRTLSKLYKKIKKHDIYYEWYSDNEYGTDIAKTDDAYAITEVHSDHLRVLPQNASLADVLDRECVITKLLLGVNKQQFPRLLQELAQEFSECEFAFAGFLAKPNWLFASVISNKASKKNAFEFLLNYHGVKQSDVVAFGDSHSDEVFLKLAGLGVAMGNATENVKKCANMTTASSNAKGVEKVLSLF